MYKISLILLLLISTALPACGAPVNSTGPWGIDIGTFTSLSTAKRSPITAGKTMVITKPMDCNSLTIPADRAIEVRPGGKIRYSGNLVINGDFTAGDYQALEKVGSGTITGLKTASPRWFGATGDGVADDLAQMTDAVIALKSSVAGTLLLGNHTYRITGQLTTGPTDSSRVSILGTGNSIIYLDGTTAAVNVRNSKTSIMGVQFKQNPANDFSNIYAALDILNVSDVTVKHCIFYGLKKGAVVARADTPGNLSRITITANHFIDNGVGDITVRGYDATRMASDVIISANTFVSPTSPMNAGTADIQLRAVHIHPYSKHITVTGNTLSGPAGFSGGNYTAGWRDAIMVGLSTNTGAPEYVAITSNVITGMADDGVGLSGARHVTISGNTIYDSIVTSGVYSPSDGSFYNDYITVTGNTISGMPLAAIYLKDVLHGTVTGNTLSDSQNGVVSVKQGANPTNINITSNSINNVAATGIYIDGAASGSISNNSIDGYGDAGSGLAADKAGIMIATGNVSVSGNSLANGIHGVLISGASDRFAVSNNTGNTLSGYGLYFISFTGDNFLVAYNSLGGTSGVKTGDPTPTASKIIEKNI